MVSPVSASVSSSVKQEVLHRKCHVLTTMDGAGSMVCGTHDSVPDG